MSPFPACKLGHPSLVSLLLQKTKTWRGEHMKNECLNDLKSSSIYTTMRMMNRHVGWASRAYIRAGWLDNNYINKINSYLHKYLSESDNLWFNPTPLDERDPIKISAAINKPTHMEFGPSCQFNTHQCQGISPSCKTRIC